MRRMMVEERLAYLLENAYILIIVIILLVSPKSFTSADCTFHSSLDISRVFRN
jgi:hypothetical protein